MSNGDGRGHCREGDGEFCLEVCSLTGLLAYLLVKGAGCLPSLVSEQYNFAFRNRVF